MTGLDKIALIAYAVAAFSPHMTLANTNQYRLIAFNDCNVVAEHALNQEQIEAYHALRASEKRMEAISQPVELIEDDIDRFSDQISELVNRAVQEDSDSLYIDKKLLAEQEKLSDELSSLIKSHETDFEALEKEARVIEAHARKFENQMQPILDNLDHDFVRIIGPDNTSDPYACDDKNIAWVNM